MVSPRKDVHWTMSTDWSTHYVYNVYVKSSDKEQGERKYYNLPTKIVRVVLVPVLTISVFQEVLKRFMARGGKTHARLWSHKAENLRTLFLYDVQQTPVINSRADETPVGICLTEIQTFRWGRGDNGHVININKLSRDKLLISDEPQTGLAQIQESLNSRPVPPNGRHFLMSGHFLTGRLPDFDSRIRSYPQNLSVLIRWQRFQLLSTTS